MAVHPNFPESPYEVIDPAVRWLPDNQTLRDTDYGKLLPPLVHQIREKVKEWRANGYNGATETSKALLNWGFNTPLMRIAFRHINREHFTSCLKDFVNTKPTSSRHIPYAVTMLTL